MRRLLVLALLLVANSALFSLPALAEMRHAVLYPSAQMVTAGEACISEACSSNRDGVEAVLNVNMFDREYTKVEKSDTEYSLIGVIYNNMREGAGTAFLIGPCYILTNRHVVIGEDGRTNSKFYFYIGASIENDFKLEISSELVEYGRNISTGEDFAVLKLDRCVGEQYGYAKILNWGLDMIQQVRKHNVAIKMAGYPGSESRKEISVDEDCMVPSFHPLDETALAENCNSARGSSGSPIFISKTTTHQIYVFAMHSGATDAPDAPLGEDDFYRTKYANDPRYFNRAVPMSGIYERIKKYLPEDAGAK